MDFRNFFKNKFVIAAIVLIVLIAISAGLTMVNDAFMIVCCVLSSALCAVVATKFVVDLVNEKKNDNASLLPLTQQERTQVNRSEKSSRTFTIIKIVCFYVFALVFLFIIF